MAAKKKITDEPESGSSATAVMEPPKIHGVALSFGDTKGGGSEKKPLVAIVPRKTLDIVKGFNPRQHLTGISELAANIKKDGLVTSVTVRPKKGKPGHFDLVAGERRVRALDMLGWEELPVLIRTDLEGDDERSKAVAVAENSEDGRHNLNPIEIGRVCKELEDKKWPVARIAAECGLHQQKVRRCLALLDAPKDVQKAVEAGEMSMITGIEVAKLDPKTRAKVKDQLTSDTSAASVRRLVKAATQDEPTSGKAANRKKGVERDASLAAWKPSKVKQTVLRSLCHALQTSEENEIGTPQYHTVRGSIAALLWDRGELKTPLLPDEKNDAKEAKALLKKFSGIVAAEAAKHTPEPGEGGEGEGDEGEGE
jgi:ParB family chromosome partitioning protein